MNLFALARAAQRRLLPSMGAGAAIEKYRQQITEARSAVARWKSECARLNAQLAALQSVKRESAARRHQIASPLVLRHLLSSRAAAFRARPVPDTARARDLTMLEGSTSYRRAVDQGADVLTDRADRMTIAGLTWWVPRDRRTPADRQDQGLPFRAIIQAREAAVGPVMLDVGANIGRMAIPRLILGDVQAVYAAEPDPLNYACLVQTIVANGLRGFVLPEQVAIGATEGVTRLLRSRYIGGHRVVRDDGPPLRAGAEVVEVPCTTLDRWVANLGVCVEELCFIKIDTQGSERQVLLGAAGLLERPHIAWQIEFDPELLRRAGCEPEEMFALLESSFTHFIDLHKGAIGRRVRRIQDLREALGYHRKNEHAKTNLLLYTARP